VAANEPLLARVFDVDAYPTAARVGTAPQPQSHPAG
jgi:hypothetical protein